MDNADRRGRAPQRRHDRARRLRRRARPAPAPRGAPDLLRPRDRGRGGAPREPSRSWPRLLDRLESAEGRRDRSWSWPRRSDSGDELCQHNAIDRSHEQQLERAAARYLDLLKARAARRALPRERVADRVPRPSCARAGHARLDAAILRDPPSRHAARCRDRAPRSRPGARAARTGRAPSRTSRTPRWGAAVSTTSSAASTTRPRRRVEGDLVECGTGRGGGAIFLRGYLEAHELHEPQGLGGRHVPRRRRPRRTTRRRPTRWPFRRPEPRCATASRASGCSTTGSASCRAPRRHARRARSTDVASLRIGDDLAASATDGARRGLRPGRGRRHRRRRRVIDAVLAQAVEDFRAGRGIAEPLERVDGRGDWRKAAEARCATGSALSVRAGDAPLARRSPRTRAGRPIDLSVVVVFYNMRREAERTLQSLSRAYQRGIDDLDYEVIVVENGSDAGPEARRRLRPRGSGPSSATSTSATRRRRRPCPRSTAASRWRAATPSRS